MRFEKIVLAAALCSLLIGCATGGRDSQKKLRALIADQKMKEAADLVKDDKFLPEKENTLLKLVETGTADYLSQNYYQALKAFDAAQELSDQLFTKSISKAATAAVTNDNADNYYGEKYERSLIRFYQSLSHYALYSVGKTEAYSVIEKDEKGKVTAKKEMPSKELSANERQFHLTAAKNVLLEWDSMLSSIRATSGGQATYKDDLLAKLYGAFIHEQMGTSTDLQIAKDLYKAAKDLLFKNFNIYQTYNAKFLDFKKNFNKFESMDIKAVENNFTKPTVHYTELVRFIDSRLEKLNKGVKDNLFIIIENGLIADKQVKKTEFPIPGDKIVLPSAAVGMAAVGTKDFVTFVKYVLKAGASALPKIYFEVPEIPLDLKLANAKQELVVKDLSGKEIQVSPLVIVDPLSDIANETLEEKATSTMIRTGTRVAAKHIAAIGSAYVLYLAAVKKGIPEFAALAGAVASYTAANKLIEKSESADLRSWAILPSSYRLSSFKLPKGAYQVFMRSEGKELFVGQLEVVNESAAQMISFRNI